MTAAARLPLAKALGGARFGQSKTVILSLDLAARKRSFSKEYHHLRRDWASFAQTLAKVEPKPPSTWVCDFTDNRTCAGNPDRRVWPDDSDAFIEAKVMVHGCQGTDSAPSGGATAADQHEFTQVRQRHTPIQTSPIAPIRSDRSDNVGL